MNILFLTNEIIMHQLNQLLNPYNFIIYSILTIFIVIIFYYIYGSIRIEYFKIDGVITPKEKSMYISIFITYFIWAFIQQTIVLSIISLISNKYIAYVTGVILFSLVYHWRNPCLIIITGLLGINLYALWIFFDSESLIYVSFAHSLGGTLLNHLGFDLRVWWSMPKEKRWSFHCLE